MGCAAVCSYYYLPSAVHWGNHLSIFHVQGTVRWGKITAFQRTLYQGMGCSSSWDMTQYIFAKSCTIVCLISWDLLNGVPCPIHHWAGIEQGFPTVPWSPQSVKVIWPSPPDPVPINPLIALWHLTLLAYNFGTHTIQYLSSDVGSIMVWYCLWNLFWI